MTDRSEHIGDSDVEKLLAERLELHKTIQELKARIRKLDERLIIAGKNVGMPRFLYSPTAPHGVEFDIYVRPIAWDKDRAREIIKGAGANLSGADLGDR